MWDVERVQYFQPFQSYLRQLAKLYLKIYMYMCFQAEHQDPSQTV